MILLDRINKKATDAGPDKGKLVSNVEEFVVNFILPILLLAAAIGIFALYVSPARQELPKLKSEATAKEQEVKILQAKVAQLTTLEFNRDLVLADLVKLSWALEERDKVPELTEQVRLMSADSGVQFKSLSYANADRGELTAIPVPSVSLTPDPELYREEKVNTSLEMPDYLSVIKFLTTTEQSIRLLKVESLKLSTLNQVNMADIVMVSPYLNPAFSAYSQTAAPINLTDAVYRSFMERLETFKNYAQEIDATLPKI